MFHPHSIQARTIEDLFGSLILIGGAILATIIALVIYAAIRFRERPGQLDPPQVFGHLGLEIAWTAGPVLLLIAIFSMTVMVMRASDPQVPADLQPDIVVIGHQWWWEVQYPRAGAVTANEVHLPVGRRMLVALDSADVIHDFFIPEVGRKMDMVPGHPTRLWLSSDAVGTYLGACAEYCGVQHGWMRIRAVVEEPNAFEGWLDRQRRAAASPASDDERRGARLFTSRACASRHAVTGTSANARIGPDLTHVASRPMLAAERLSNSPDNLGRWLEAPDIFKRDSHMRNLHPSPMDVRALVAYMETLQ